MSLLNYTTKIEVSKTVGEIQSMLAKNGASSIKSDYDNEGNVVALSFLINLDGKTVGIKLPTDWNPVLEIMKQDRKVLRSKCTKEQAMKVSWRIIKDWVEAQMAILQTKMVKMEQIFLPYIIVRNDGQTLFEKMRENPELLLAEKN